MIVILIIAVVILGLALGFINGMFSSIEKDFIGRANEEPEPPTATPSDPLTLSKGDNMVVTPGEELVLKLGVYCNDEATGCVDTYLDSIVCTNDVILIDYTSIQTSYQTIGYGNSATIIGLVPIPKNAPLGKILCSVYIIYSGSTSAEYITKDIVLDVMK